MKTFIYFSEDEWRTFQAEELPVKPMITDVFKTDMSLASRSRIYESEIAALKAKSVKVGNINEFTWPPDFHERLIDLGGMKVYQWPGTVEVQISKYEGDNDLAILKLPA
jgi:hypothetical protein